MCTDHKYYKYFSILRKIYHPAREIGTASFEIPLRSYDVGIRRFKIKDYKTIAVLLY
jgi:hypothetical protein